jgi:SnoaL-like domain
MDDNYDSETKSRLQIMDLSSRYTRAGDTGREDEFVTVFTDDGVFEVDKLPPARGATEITAVIARVKGAFARAPAAFFPARHHVSSLNIRFEDDDHASGRSYYLLVGAWGPDHWGTYRDTYERRDAEWRFSYRKATMEGAVAHSPMAFLLTDAPWPSG